MVVVVVFVVIVVVVVVVVINIDESSPMCASCACVVFQRRALICNKSFPLDAQPFYT